MSQLRGHAFLEKAIASYQKISSYKIDSADVSQFLILNSNAVEMAENLDFKPKIRYLSC